MLLKYKDVPNQVIEVLSGCEELCIIPNSPARERHSDITQADIELLEACCHKLENRANLLDVIVQLEVLHEKYPDEPGKILSSTGCPSTVVMTWALRPKKNSSFAAW